MAMALSGASPSRYTIVPAREILVSASMRHQPVAVTALLAARVRKFGLDTDADTDAVPAGDNAVHNHVPWCVILVEGPLERIRPLTNAPQECYTLHASIRRGWTASRSSLSTESASCRSRNWPSGSCGRTTLVSRTACQRGEKSAGTF